MLTSDPRFSFQLQNGFMKKSSKNIPANSLDDELESWYFKPADEDVKVNADSFKVNIGQEVVDGDNTKWIVLPEFEGVFGYLNNSNKKERAEQRKRKLAYLLEMQLLTTFRSCLRTRRCNLASKVA